MTHKALLTINKPLLVTMRVFMGNLGINRLFIDDCPRVCAIIRGIGGFGLGDAAFHFAGHEATE